eukprot:10527890-Heterocapsa_arctica.AAC.1
MGSRPAARGMSSAGCSRGYCQVRGGPRSSTRGESPAGRGTPAPPCFWEQLRPGRFPTAQCA